MQLKRGFEQSVCILALLATQEQDIPLSSTVIHARLKGSQTYLRKLMRKLVVGGLVTSASGNNGGFRLARDPAEINLAQIVEVVEGPLVSYPSTNLFNAVFSDFKPLAKEGNSAIQRAFATADALWIKQLAKVTIYQLLCETFNTKIIPRIDWNHLGGGDPDQIEALIKKIKNSLKL